MPDAELPAEFLLYAPSYFIQLGRVATAGWNNGNPASTLTHLLSVASVWQADAKLAASKFSHVSRMEVMDAHGFWWPTIHAERAATRSLLFLPEVAVVVAARQHSIQPLRWLVERGMRAAALTKQVLVLPEISCDAPWIIRSNDSNVDRIADPRLIVVPAAGVVPTACHVGSAKDRICWPWDFVVHEFDAAAAARRHHARRAPWDATALREARDDVVLTHLPARLKPANAEEEQAIEQARRECSNYFTLPEERNL